MGENNFPVSVLESYINFCLTVSHIFTIYEYRLFRAILTYVRRDRLMIRVKTGMIKKYCSINLYFEEVVIFNLSPTRVNQGKANSMQPVVTKHTTCKISSQKGTLFQCEKCMIGKVSKDFFKKYKKITNFKRFAFLTFFDL